MARTRTDDSDEGEDFADYEPEYHPEADEAGELWCPKCGAVMYADASLCPSCNEYVTPGARPAGPMPLWMWVIGIAVVILIGLGLVGAIFAIASP
ncbi:MAG: hypothetical protein ACREKH_09350 [Candidatus Rokuibacteriota bacterium]